MAFSVGTAALVSFGSIARAAVYTAPSCSASDVQATASSASDGDTVLVPGGSSCTWTTVVTMTKGFTLDGQGVADIAFGSGAGLALNAQPGASAVVTGFAFHNGFINGGYPIAVNTTSAPLNAPFRIYGNRLDDAGHQGGPVTLIGVVGFGPGLIDHNTMTTANGADEVIHLLGSGSAADTSGWSNDVVPGGPDMVFLENNVFTNTSGTVSSSAEEAYYGAQMVFRYNTLTFEANDVHQGGLSGRWAEIYGNTYAVAGVNLSAYWQFRGGSGLVYDNVASGAPCCQDPYPTAQFGPDCPSSDQCTGAWPIATQVGTGINQTTSSPVYVWANASTVDGSTQSIQDSLGYTNGTQAGATPTACTHPGGVCDVVATTTAPSSWVRCESAADVAAGCPVSYSYTPYPYPHPLDNLSPACAGMGCPVATTGDGGVDAAGDAAPAPGSEAGAGTDASAADAGDSGGADGSVGPCAEGGVGSDAGAPARTDSGGSDASGGPTGLKGGSAGGCGCTTVDEPERGGCGAAAFAMAGVLLAFVSRRRGYRTRSRAAA